MSVLACMREQHPPAQAPQEATWQRSVKLKEHSPRAQLASSRNEPQRLPELSGDKLRVHHEGGGQAKWGAHRMPQRS